jgi:hypothetical protein
VVCTFKAHRRAFSDAWVACLKLDLTPALYRSITVFLPKHVINQLNNPLQVCEWGFERVFIMGSQG